MLWASKPLLFLMDWDKEEFAIDNPIINRDPLNLLGMYSDKTWKGSHVAIEAANLVREQQPDVKMMLFGTESRPDDLPAWIDYASNPRRSELRRIYNQSAIFMASSFTEGWGLPPCEAMLCGCAVVATDIGGYREFCYDAETALIVPPGNPQAMADAVHKLVANPDLRGQIAMQGHEYVKRFDWELATDQLLAAIEH
jgi:glycosyltransferase involved in cell wall biosynthesis